MGPELKDRFKLVYDEISRLVDEEIVGKGVPRNIFEKDSY
jgi:hypothetical protein